MGRRGARIEYVVLMVVAYAAPVVLLLFFGQRAWILLPFLTLPLGLRLVQAVFTTLGPALNRTLAGTSQLALLYSVAFAAGLLL